MNVLLKPLALIGLLLTILPAILLLVGGIELSFCKLLMIVGMVFWYAGAIPWLGFAKK